MYLKISSIFLYISIFLILLIFPNYVLSDKLTVSYDNRAIIINGERKLLYSASIHYPRSTRTMWPDILKRTKAAGINTIETYIFWNLHQPTPDTYDFEGSSDVKHFLDLCKEEGFHVIVRFGPYVCAEWNNGGLPSWLKAVPGIVYRTHNEPFMREMKKWMDYIVHYLSDYYAPNGGPIIMAQIENEYGWLEYEYREQGGPEYVDWAVKLAKSYNTGIPWIMCQQNTRSDVINTCNGFYCHDWLQYHQRTFPDQPAFFTELWTGWPQYFEEGFPTRPTVDVLYSAARFYSRGGGMVNYYMWHGGTTFGRFTSPFLTTSYDYDAPLDEYGFPQEPKYSMLTKLHVTLEKYSSVILHDPNVPPPYVFPDNTVEMIEYKKDAESVVFLVNWDDTFAKQVDMNGKNVKINQWSVQIYYNNELVFDTFEIPANLTRPNPPFKPIAKTSLDATAAATSRTGLVNLVSSWNEPFSFLTYNASSQTPTAQLKLTGDNSDYIWYETEIDLTKTDEILYLYKSYDFSYVFVDGQFLYWHRGSPIQAYFNGKFPVGKHTLQILCAAMGVPSYGAHIEQHERGLTGDIFLGSKNITDNGWKMRPFLSGELLGLHASPSTVKWSPVSKGTAGSGVTWYKFNVKTPSFEDGPAFALDLKSMWKGLVFVNGNSIGRYWVAKGWCEEKCNQTGLYDNYGCRENCGESSQRYYHVPKDFLKESSDNEVIIFEELQGDPYSIELVQRNTEYRDDYQHHRIESNGILSSEESSSNGASSGGDSDHRADSGETATDPPIAATTAPVTTNPPTTPTDASLKSSAITLALSNPLGLLFAIVSSLVVLSVI
ncbi:hypothetical protein DFA_01529 [Cavenderia fasciculata]|uniref:Beta-galactosidase n=1 Tax=Cavenderia fasciculata TaxID=261658 RepID=F4PTC1_CACFS|nr:uncharacterized protein DFA_01529 [Cavenderia fasciculata]EGG21643.1 hypothetical protein DFA_01529 [Cavenderia fasciculata]|eukprot:XP_004359493.1 hypothetical protein DFA_01529 [Cavenderia fasciculata]